LEYFQLEPPKSLGKEYFEQVFKFTLNNNPISIQDQLHTFGKHLAHQVSKWVKDGTCLSTGGGTYNDFWIEEIQRQTPAKIIIPEASIIDFKEALVFAFLGLLRMLEQVNTLNTVTGAKKDSVGGCVYLP
jgi:anhydro-N-acetylmuramic acid kinase